MSETKSCKKIEIEKIYQKKTQLEHILLRPDTYIGSVERVEQEMWVWNMETEKMCKKTIKYVPGLFKIFDEILVNAADNKIRDPSMNVIKINIDKSENMIKVYNNGKGIPVVEHKGEKVFVPTLIFGHLLTSSNYDDNEKKVTGGRNGYGAKLCNIFSTKFIVETSCKESKKYFKQVWQSNMGKTQEATIKPNKENDFTCVTFYPDLKKFGMDSLEEDTISLLARRAYDVAASTRGVKVYLNDKRLPISKFEDYCKLYVSNNTGESELDILNTSTSQAKIIYESPNPRWEVAISYSDIGFQQVSFVNSIATTKGGRHVDHICEQIIKHISDVVNKKNGKNSTQVKPFQIKNHLWLFVNCLIENPVFESQTKECMSLQVKNFGSKCQLSEEFLKKVSSRSGIVDRVLNWLAFKEKTDLEKTGPKSKLSKVKGIPKLDDANNAGTRDSLNCTLILTEGDSAKTLAVSGLGVLGRDRYGVFPLRGKMLNVREATPKQILENAEITNICKIVGLNFKEKYESKESLKNLRYGKIMIMTDQDHDGSHIKGLIINFVHHQWPNLLKHGFIEEFITPIIKVFKAKKSGIGNEVEKAFYSMPEFEEWQKNTPDWHTWKVKYYKGLGTSTSKEAKEYFSDMNRHCIKFEYNGSRDDLAIQLAFNKRLVEDRKDWLTKFMENRNEENKNYLYQKDTRKINYSQFVNKELVLFSNLDNERSIPSVVDGFKPGQRKVLFACFKRNLQKEIKVAQLAGSVAELSAYHHGEQSLMSTIINLAQNFVGSNNLNLLLPIGQFGTRLHGGKDAASPRYIFTNLNILTRFIFNPKDDPLFNYLNDDGQFVEPEYYCPIIPMVLVNGAEGIGTGWAVKVPNFNPKEIIENLIRILKNQELLPMKPYYKNFKGTIETLDESRFLVSGEVALIDDGDTKNDYSVEISELPVGTWTQVYKESVLETYLHGTDAKTTEGKGASFSPLINDYKEYHTDCTVRFIVKMTAKQYQNALDQGGLHKFFKLQKTISLNNMVLFDSHGCLRRFESPNEILKEFYQVRLDYYKKRKEYLESMLGAESAKLDNIARFIIEKIEGKIKVENLKKNDLIKQLINKGYQSDPVKKWKEKIANEKGYLIEANSESNLDEEPTDISSQNDFNYLLSMPIWNLTLEKKEEILRQQKSKLSELKNLQSKTHKDLWLEDLSQFKLELDKYEQKEKEELDLTIKKSIKSQKSKPNQVSNIRHEYLPDPDGERVVPKPDAQLIAKAEKDAQQKILIKSKKEETLKGLNIVDIVTSDEKYNDEQLKQITELASNLANPNKAKIKQANTPKKVNTKPENDETLELSTIDKSINNDKDKRKTKTPAKKKEKIVVNTDSEESFDEDKFVSKEADTIVEKRQLGRARKSIRYNFNEESSEESIEEFDHDELTATIQTDSNMDQDPDKEICETAKKTPAKRTTNQKNKKPPAKKAKIENDEEDDFQNDLEYSLESDFESESKKRKSSSKKLNTTTTSRRKPQTESKKKSAEFILDSEDSSNDEKSKKNVKRGRKSKSEELNDLD